MSIPNRGKASARAMEALHGALADALADKIRTGEFTAADLSVARAFLKDNGIDGIPSESNPLGRLADQLPFKDDPEEDE